MSEQLENLSITDLQKHFDYVEKLLTEKKNAIRETTVAQLEEIAKSAGIAISIKGQRKKKGEQATEKLYRHPDSDKQNLTWNGQGAAPGWLKTLVKKTGKEISEFEVKVQPE